MQYLSRGKYGTGEPFGAGWREARTNSGEGSLERWDSKLEVQGAGGVVRCWVVVDMVRSSERRRNVGREAMMVFVSGMRIGKVKAGTVMFRSSEESQYLGDEEVERTD